MNKLVFAKKPTKNTAIRVKGISEKIVLFLSGRLQIKAEIHKIKKIFAILLPKTLPIAISELPLKLARILITSSGAEVPKETIVRPMTKSEILNFLAIDEAPSTSRSAPLIRITNPTTKSKIVTIIRTILMLY